jgi:hypothetical protein
MSVAVIIGSGTIVSFGSGCVQSANWAFNPGKQDAFCLGETAPSNVYRTFKPSSTLSLTVYASSGQTYSTVASTTCTDADTISATVSPAVCGTTTIDGVSGEWWVTGYSYSKEDSASPGTESWSLTNWKVTSGIAGAVIPSAVLRGISQGQSSGVETGITLDIEASSTTGSVSANGFGKGYAYSHGTVSKVGSGSKTGTGNGNASIPYTQLYF